MARLSVPERLRLAALSGDRSRRRAVSRALSSPLLRWSYGAAIADQLLIVPQDLRTADPSFWREVELDQFGLAGSTAVLKGCSPFDVSPPSAAWLRALHGFGWLHHLEAAHTEPAREAARQLVCAWIAKNRGGPGVPWQPAVIARRLISWLSHANFLLENADPRTYDAITSSLGMQLAHLASTWRDAPVGYPRLLTLLTLVLAGLCIAGHDRQLEGAERAFAAELSRQILPDGGHASRNPCVLVDILLDLLPLRQCFATRGRPPPEVIDDRTRRMLTMLRYLRLGDGMLGRFNGMGVPSAASLATVLAYDLGSRPIKWAQASNYARLARGDGVILMDAGPPPPLELAAEAHAGCLSFEMSTGTRLLFVNGGAPAPMNADWRAASRATASHNTLCLAETSSSTLVRNAALEHLIGAPPIRAPDNVAARVGESETGISIDGQHDGYVKRFGVVHLRRLELDTSGRKLEGVDRLEAAQGRQAAQGEFQFAIHFHLHPNASCYHAKAGVAAEIVLNNEQQWRFSVEGATLSIEESIFYADYAGPRPSQQIVLRGTFPGQSEVRWRVAARE